jgi:hypothetical protein
MMENGAGVDVAKRRVGGKGRRLAARAETPNFRTKIHRSGANFRTKIRIRAAQAARSLPRFSLKTAYERM